MLGTVSTFYDVDAVLIAVSADDDAADILNGAFEFESVTIIIINQISSLQPP